MSFDPVSTSLLDSLIHFCLVFGTLILALGVVSVVISLFAFGFQGPALVVNKALVGCIDLTRLSCRRIFALTMLTVKEAIRRKALMVFVIFAALFMFAGWFLSDTNARAEMQAKVHLSFVLTAITWLVLPIVLLLSCWGLPEDIKARSIHTVVTKPARRSEIVVGRILGFTLISTFVLVVMAAVGYVWTMRQVEKEPICRVPVYGTLHFLDRVGEPAKKGLNVGDIWEFRGYIEGASKAAAIWEFDDIDESSLRDGTTLILESTFEAFRTHKGKMGEGLLCRMLFRKGELDVPIKTFPIHEFSENLIEISRTLHHDGKDYDVINDLASDGKLRIVVQCLDAGQYLGMARPDLFIRLPDRPFWVGYGKAVLGIWLMLTLVVILSVTASCFVKGPVATISVLTFIIVGTFFGEFMEKIVVGAFQGGGPLESMYRIWYHMNPMTKLPDTVAFSVMKAIDSGWNGGLWLIHNIIPDFSVYRVAPYIANGFDVPWAAALLPSILQTLAFALPCLLIGYFSLAIRELEAK